MITKEKRGEIVKKFAKQPHDTGATNVQIALITERIGDISGHLKNNKKDYATQLGLLRLVGRRRRLLGYLKRTDADGYNQLIKQLDLRK